MRKSPDAFRTISEVADWLDVPTHVLRFWESKFSQIKPVKRAGGRRYYRPADMELIGGIKTLLHDDGQTIRAVQKILSEKGVKHVSSLSKPVSPEDDDDVIELTAVEVTVEETTGVQAAPVEAAASEPAEAKTGEAVDADSSPSAPDLIDLMSPALAEDPEPAEPSETEVAEASPEPAEGETTEEVDPEALDEAPSQTVDDPVVAGPARSTRRDIASDADEAAVDEAPAAETEVAAAEPVSEAETQVEPAAPSQDADTSTEESAGLALASRLRRLNRVDTVAGASELTAHRAALIALRDRVAAHLDG